MIINDSILPLFYVRLKRQSEVFKLGKKNHSISRNPVKILIIFGDMVFSIFLREYKKIRFSFFLNRITKAKQKSQEEKYVHHFPLNSTY